MSARLPNFFNALKGIWLLTWRSQWTWARFPGRFGMLLVLPALVLLTVVGNRAWMRRHADFGNPYIQLNPFFKRLEKWKIPADDRQKAKLLQIFSEEYARSQNSWHEVAVESPEARKERLENMVSACDQRIVDRAGQTLNEQQTTEFQAWDQRNRAAILARLGATQTPWGRTAPFYHWLIDFYFFIILPLTCVRACGALIRDELQADTLGFLVTRPVSRARLLVAKYVSQVAWLEIILLAETLLLFAAGVMRDVPTLGTLLPLFLFAQFLAIPAWGALGVLLGQITSRYMAAALIYGAVVELGIGQIPTNINTISLLRHIETLLSQNRALQNVFSWDVGGTATAIASLILAPVIFMTVAALLFSLLEYHATSEMQK
ncbi:MAG TPA: ABC transporter permease subunit [Verrucomicrobiae bacterium]|nr:ABC transporter permease subunit [Verrucomicrobiae bacterium]